MDVRHEQNTPSTYRDSDTRGKRMDLAPVVRLYITVMLHSWLADGCTEDAARKSAPWKREIEQKYIEPRLRSPRVVGMVLDLYDESVQFASFVHASSAPNFRLNGSPVTDCIHFCMPGAPDRWASRFFQLVAGSTELQAPPPAAVQQSKV